MSTPFGEFFRLPTLIHHYWEHKEKDNYTLIKFLTEHYAKKINHPDDKHHDHEKLPFKVLDLHSLQLVTIVAQPTFSIFKIAFYTAEIKASICKQHYSNMFLNSIWQPPRFS